MVQTLAVQPVLPQVVLMVLPQVVQ